MMSKEGIYQNLTVVMCLHSLRILKPWQELRNTGPGFYFLFSWRGHNRDDLRQSRGTPSRIKNLFWGITFEVHNEKAFTNYHATAQLKKY